MVLHDDHATATVEGEEEEASVDEGNFAAMLSNILMGLAASYGLEPENLDTYAPQVMELFVGKLQNGIAEGHHMSMAHAVQWANESFMEYQNGNTTT